MVAQTKPISVEDYKHTEYMKLGFTDYEARRLVEVPGLGPSRVREMLSKGCTVKIAYRIFRP